MALSKADRSLQAARHSAVALLGAALQEVFPAIQLIGGRATSLGFVYDVVGNIPADTTLLSLVEERMRAIINRDLPLRSREMVRENAAEFFRHRDQSLKAESLQDYPEGLVGLLEFGPYMDLAPLPHVQSLSEVKAVCLLSVSTAPRLLPSGEEVSVTSIAGTVQRDPQQLKTFVKRMKASKDNRADLLAKELELFTVQEGLALWHPKGTCLADTLLAWWRTEMARLGFQTVTTKGIDAADDYPFPVSRARRHALLYHCGLHSYRALPLGYAESGDCWEPQAHHEPGNPAAQPVYTCPEATLFCQHSQVQKLLQSHMRFLVETLNRFQLEWRAYLTAGTAQPADKRRSAAGWVKQALEAEGIAFTDDDEEHASEGPLLQLRIVDDMGREWLGPSLQVNITQPDSLRLRYQASDDTMRQPVMISLRAFGSLERWICLLLEKTRGEFPFWLAPEQVRLLPVNEEQLGYMDQVRQDIESAGFRVGVDSRDERLAAKIYAFEKAKVPFGLILGDSECTKQTVTVRKPGDGRKGQSLTLQAFLAMLSSV